ncbi:hypothetical protein ASD83_13945 [Devosia sp. Root685]|uniref:DUF6634 family protein n=1 Tax=Devosia sp. Root685 TaxID=1736587 RepID=UPI0006F636F1|nr:DUF6634 family protein [Devosia sp. Root685]KRA98147.1 hypothetical protein ASD83_13945 [Devosia sp. Root685]
MLLFEQNGFADPVAAWQKIEKLEALARDLRRMLQGEGLSPGELEAATTISNWIAIDRRVPALVGFVADHPDLPGSLQGRRLVTTSEIAVWGNSEWVRTASRYYRFGEPFEPLNLSEAAK